MASIREWLFSDQTPDDFYVLLGRPRLDPDRQGMLASLRQFYAELLLFQNHPEMRIAARAVALQRELGRAELVLSDVEKLRAYNRALCQVLRRQYAAAEGHDPAEALPGLLAQWLEEHHVHPGQVQKVCQVLGHEENASTEPADDNDPFAEILAEIQRASPRGGARTASGKRRAPRAGKAPPWQIFAESALRAGRRILVTLDDRIKASAGQSGTRLLGLRAAACAAPCLVLGLVAWLLWPASKMPPTRLTSAAPPPTATYRLTIQPPDAAVGITGQGVHVEGEGAHRLLRVEVTNPPTPVRLQVRRQGYESWTEPIDPVPGEHRDILVSLAPAGPLAAPPPENRVPAPSSASTPGSTAAQAPAPSPPRLTAPPLAATAPQPSSPLPSDGSAVFGPVEPVWAPVDAARAAQIRSGRETVTKDLEEISWSDLVFKTFGQMTRRPSRGPYRSYPSRSADAHPLPERFILTGDLAAVRVSKGRTVVYLTDCDEEMASRRFSGFDYRRAAIEIPTEELKFWMADYRAGERVRAVVHREPDAAGSIPASIHLTERVAPYRSELRGVFMRSAVFRFVGEGLEKVEQPDTWIDARLGRAAQVTNREALQLSNTQLLRDLQAAKGARGTIRGKLVSLTRFSQSLLIEFTVETLEGTCVCEAELEGPDRLANFLDYRKDDPIVVRMEVLAEGYSYPGSPSLRGPQLMRVDLTSPSRSPMSPDDLLPSWSGLWAQAERVEIEGKSSTAVGAGCPPRSDVHWEKLSPDVAYAAGPQVLGRDVTWEGTLKKIRRCGGETHLLVEVAETLFNLRDFDAFTVEPTFLGNVADYRDDEQIVVHGRIANADARHKSLWRLVPVTGRDRVVRRVPLEPVVEIREVRRAGDEASRAVVGQRRTPTPQPAYAADSLAALLRDYPAAGTEVTFRANYSSFNTYDSTVSVCNHEGRRNDYVYLAGAKKEDFDDYKYDQPVVVKAITDERSDLSDSPKMTLKSISRDDRPQ